VQHLEAQRLLPILAEAARRKKPYTYKSAAKALGRDPRRNARMVAQVCDLLDAAAAIAGVPSLALFTVREATGAINTKAWRKGEFPPGLRDAIVSRASLHTFTRHDFAAIKSALDSLAGMSNRAAWAKFWASGPQLNLYRSLTGADPAPNFDAINDIGADAPLIITTSSTRYARDERIRNAVLLRAGGQCELCGAQGFLRDDGSRYLESHHIIALAKEGPDRMSNVIALCANEHREAHFGKRRSELEKQMIQIVRRLAVTR